MIPLVTETPHGDSTYLEGVVHTHSRKRNDDGVVAHLDQDSQVSVTRSPIKAAALTFDPNLSEKKKRNEMVISFVFSSTHYASVLLFPLPFFSFVPAFIDRRLKIQLL